MHLTNKEAKPYDSLASTAKATGAPVYVIKIRPEMLVKARAIFSAWLDRWEYLVDGTPHQDDIDGLLLSLLALGRSPTLDR